MEKFQHRGASNSEQNKRRKREFIYSVLKLCMKSMLNTALFGIIRLQLV